MPSAIFGSAVFFALPPGTVGGRIPFLLTDWRVERPLLGLTSVRIAGAAMVLAGVASLLVSFARFAIKGPGTPAPVAPPTRLVVSGQYRHVRNPMYEAVLAIVLGQSLARGSIRLLGNAAVLWLLFHDWVVWYEEPKLGTQFGQFYRTYQESVRRWWPRIRPWNAQHSTMAR